MLHVFCDESGADGQNRYLVHGALLVRDAAIVPLRAALKNVFRADKIPDELKWSSLSKRSLERDLKCVDRFFDVYETDGKRSAPRFQALIVDQHRVDVRKYHQGDGDMCFYKFLYPLLQKRIGGMGAPGEPVHIILDKRCVRSYQLTDLRGALNNGIRKEFGPECPMVKSVEYRDSKADELLQLSDFLTGAVGFCQNGRDKSPTSSKSKLAAAQYVSKQVGVPLNRKQLRNDQFGLWSIRLS